MISAIIPASGLATRMRGLPKFLLPVDENYSTLLEGHIDNLREIVDELFVPVNPAFYPIVSGLLGRQKNLHVFPLSTNTMSETVQKVVAESKAQKFVLCMPDTFFLGEKPYIKLVESESFISLACWRIRPEQIGKLGQLKIDSESGRVLEMRDKDKSCKFEWSWGAMQFSAMAVEKLLDPEAPHVGYMAAKALDRNQEVQAIAINGQYFDCGTPSEYFALLRLSGSI